MGLHDITSFPTMQYAPFVVIYPSIRCFMEFRLFMIGIGRPVEMKILIPFALAASIALMVDSGIW